MGKSYDFIRVKTNKNTYEIQIYQLPVLVIEYLADFYEHGWTPENDEKWEQVFDIIRTFIVPNEEIKEITGETFFTDIIYKGD